MTQELECLLEQATQSISQSDDLASLDAIRVTYLGKKGEITHKLKNLSQVSAEERPAAGQAINQIKVRIQTLLEQRKTAISDALIVEKLRNDTVDITLPGRRNQAGGIHPVTLTMNRIQQMFGK